MPNAANAKNSKKSMSLERHIGKRKTTLGEVENLTGFIDLP
jgi:hypothetical protein